MKILFLGPENCRLVSFLREAGEEVVAAEEKLDTGKLLQLNCQFLVSYGYRFILGRSILDLFPQRAINLHISLLPWNRGASPNFWSFLENTPKGVSIHLIDEGIDTGDILVQKEVHLSMEETLASSYDILKSEIEALFKSHWNELKAGSLTPTPQTGSGTNHLAKELERYSDLLENGWDTPVRKVYQYGKEHNLFLC